MNLCYLALGSNLKSPQRQLHLALKALQQLPKSHLLKVAPFYFNEAWGRKNQPHFYNTVACLQTTLSPHQLLKLCQRIEKKQGRVRKLPWGSRTLDLDILFYGDLKIKTKKLVIPHPLLHLRDFVLKPLSEICPKNNYT